jgi:GrpB-like predicted nucleotidyltransferase (UPF0157 family)
VTAAEAPPAVRCGDVVLKPAIEPLNDIMVAAPHPLTASCVVALARLGYQRDPSGDFPGRGFLRRLNPSGQPTHHLSLAEPEGPYWRDQLAFRNALRADPDLCRRYAELKRQLAAEHGRGIAYTRGKTAFIRRALETVGHRAESGWASELSR